jgi:predicted nucleotidyltransferase
MTDAITLLRQHEADLKNRFGVATIGVFGSYIRGEMQPDDTIDVLVTFLHGEECFDNFMGCKTYLEDLFGRGVSLFLHGTIKNRLSFLVPSEIVFAWGHAPYLDDIPVPLSCRKITACRN